MLREIINSFVKRPPDRRREHRDRSITGSVSIGGRCYPLKDLTTRGFAVRAYRDEHCPGDRMPISLSLGRPADGLDFVCQAVVIRVDRAKGELAGVFADLDRAARDGIAEHIDGPPPPAYTDPAEALASD